jgi:hypothetical protein
MGFTTQTASSALSQNRRIVTAPLLRARSKRAARRLWSRLHPQDESVTAKPMRQSLLLLRFFDMAERQGHTPGEWRRVDMADYAEIMAPDGTKVALVGTEADAWLISAAPDLLEQLRDLVNKHGYRMTAAELAKARATIAKAVGKEPS